MISVPRPSTSTTATSSAIADRISSSNSDSAPIIAFVTNQFHWRLIESTNYDTYVANLRDVSCPEKTIRDIVLADARKHYKKLKDDCELDVPFWSAGRERRAAEKQSTLCTESLEQEEFNLVKRLLSVEPVLDLTLENPEHLEQIALMRFVLGPMSEEKIQKVLSITARYSMLRERVKQNALGIVTDDDDQEILRLGAEQGRELAATLSPQEFDEMSARASALRTFEGNSLAPSGLSGSDVRSIFLMQARAHDFSTLFDFSEVEPAEIRASRDTVFTNAVTQQLGPDKLSAYLRGVDREFRNMLELTKDNNLPQSTAIAVYEIRRVAQQELQRLRLDTDLDAEVRRERMNTVQAETEAAALKTLGKPAFDQYLNRGGSWLTNAGNL